MALLGQKADDALGKMNIVQVESSDTVETGANSNKNELIMNRGPFIPSEPLPPITGSGGATYGAQYSTLG